MDLHFTHEYIYEVSIYSNIVTYFYFSVLGALIGKQKGRKIEVMNSFELLFDIVEDDIIIDRDYYNTKEDQC